MLHLHELGKLTKEGTPARPSWHGSWNACWARCLSTTPCRRNLSGWNLQLHSIIPGVSTPCRVFGRHPSQLCLWKTLQKMHLSKQVWPGLLLWVVCKTSFWGAADQDGPDQPGDVVLLFNVLFPRISGTCHGGRTRRWPESISAIFTTLLADPLQITFPLCHLLFWLVVIYSLKFKQVISGANTRCVYLFRKLNFQLSHFLA